MNNSKLSKAGLARMNDVMMGYVERGEVPGIVTLINHHGDVHVDAIGTMTLGGKDPMQRHTILRIASMSKPVTAAATMILVEECRLRLDDPIELWLPEMANRKVVKRLDGALDDTVAAKRSITVRDLLTFTNGFGLLMGSPDQYPILKAATELQLTPAMPSPSKAPTPDEWIKRLGSLPLMHQPGEKWMYHTGSDVLSVLIARVAGQPFEKFLQDRIFEPLAMNDTAFSVPASKIDRLAASYWINYQTNKLELYDPAEGGQWSVPSRFPSGGGGLVSTVDDYNTFCQMMLGKGKSGNTRILSRASVETMMTDQLTTEQKANSAELYLGFFQSHGWGFGMSVVTKRANPGAPIGQFGWDGGMGTSARSDPNEQMTGIILTQRAFSSPLPPACIRDFWTLAYAALDD